MLACFRHQFRNAQLHFAIRPRRPFAQIRSKVSDRAVNLVHRMNQARQSDGFLIATQIQPLDLFTNRVELKRVLFLPRTLESVAPAIVFGKPAFLTWQSIQMVDQGLVMIARKWSKQVTISEHFGPDGNIIRNDAIARVCKRLRNARRTREAIENSLRIYFLS